MIGFYIEVDDVLWDDGAKRLLTFKGMDPLETVCVFHTGIGDYVAVLHMLPTTMLDFYVEGRFQEVPGAGNIREVVQEG